MYRTRLGGVVFAFLASVAFIPDAAAKTVFVGDAKLELPTPPNACFLDLTRHPYDARFLGVVQELNRGANLVLAAFTSCQELVNVRRQSQLALENYGMVLAPIGQAREPITAERAAYLDAVAGAIGEKDLLQEVIPGVRARFRSVLPEASVGESRSLGVIGRDSEAVYWGLMMRVSAARGYERVMAAVVAISVAGRTAFSVNRYRPYFDDSVFDVLKAEAQAYVRAVLAANGAAPVSLDANFDDGMATFERGDYTAALQEFQPLAGLGDASGEFGMALLYHSGQGVPQDLAKAVELYRKAAEKGFGMAQTNLGSMYLNGIGVAQSPIEAEKWYRMAAEQGVALAQHNLGFIYFMGLTGGQDDAEALKWIRLAVDQGYADAQTLLGVMYQMGRGVPQNYAQAMKWYLKAAEKGDANAQNNLGDVFRDGRGVPQDNVRAYAWFSLAVEQGHGEAKSSRSLLAKQMTATEIARAGELAAELATEAALAFTATEYAAKSYEQATAACEAQAIRDTKKIVEEMVDSGAQVDKSTVALAWGLAIAACMLDVEDPAGTPADQPDIPMPPELLKY